MKRRRRTSPPPLPSGTRGSRRSIPDEDLDDDLNMIPDNHNDHRDDISESDDEHVWRPFRNAMCKRPSTDSITSTLGERVAATQLTHPLGQPLNPERREVTIVSEEEDEPEPVLLACNKVSN